MTETQAYYAAIGARNAIESIRMTGIAPGFAKVFEAAEHALGDFCTALEGVSPALSADLLAKDAPGERK